VRIAKPLAPSYLQIDREASGFLALRTGLE
jgi:hypothetical protein